MDKGMIAKVMRGKSNEMGDGELKFTILLKNRKEDNRDKVIDDAFVRAVEYEYAVKYLEYLGIEPTPKNISIILTMAPFKECKITPGWESSGEVASTFNIYPNPKAGTNHFEKKPSKESDKLPPVRGAKKEKKKEKKVEEEKVAAPFIGEKKTDPTDSSVVPKLDAEVIKKRYMYPFSIDMTRLKKLGKNIDLIQSKALQIPLDTLPPSAEDIMSELQKPVTMKVEEMVKDLKEFVSEFQGTNLYLEMKENKKSPCLTEQEMNMFFDEIASSRSARLLGLVVHFVYWCVFGHFNQLPIDHYHKTLLFLTIQKILNEIIAQYSINKHFATFFMPMIVLSIRREVDSVFHVKYPLLFKDATSGAAAQANISLLLTKLLDPNVLYSRFSSLESRDDAIMLKLKQYFSSKTTKVKDLFYTNSSLISSLLPHKSEGIVRSRFSGTQPFLGSRRPKGLHGSLEEKALEMANNIQMCNVAFKRVNDSLQKRKLNPVFRILNIE